MNSAPLFAYIFPAHAPRAPTARSQLLAGYNANLMCVRSLDGGESLCVRRETLFRLPNVIQIIWLSDPSDSGDPSALEVIAVSRQ